MTMKAKIIISIAALLGVAAAVNRLELPLGKVTVRVLDENQKPVPAVTVSFVFEDRVTHQPAKVSGQTDNDGQFTGEGGFGPAGFGGNISKDGYYDSGAPIPKFSQIDPVTNHWLPWNQTYTTVLRPIVNPVAMYAKTGWFDIPVIDQPCGFDLEKGDWVAPYGTGSVSDFVFTLKRRYVGLEDFLVKIELRFSNPLDGIQPAELPASGRYSTFKWPREAPENGYQSTLISRSEGKPNYGITESAKDIDVYFFRVRTVEQNGRIVSACYGKINGGIAVAPMHSKTCKVQLTYYLNPTSLDRNLEWDPKRNLLSGLKFEQTPRDP
jgi:hypothetical protein